MTFPFHRTTLLSFAYFVYAHTYLSVPWRAIPHLLTNVFRSFFFSFSGRSGTRTKNIWVLLLMEHPASFYEAPVHVSQNIWVFKGNTHYCGTPPHFIRYGAPNDSKQLRFIQNLSHQLICEAPLVIISQMSCSSDFPAPPPLFHSFDLDNVSCARMFTCSIHSVHFVFHSDIMFQFLNLFIDFNFILFFFYLLVEALTNESDPSCPSSSQRN